MFSIRAALGPSGQHFGVSAEGISSGGPSAAPEPVCLSRSDQPEAGQFQLSCCHRRAFPDQGQAVALLGGLDGIRLGRRVPYLLFFSSLPSSTHPLLARTSTRTQRVAEWARKAGPLVPVGLALLCPQLSASLHGSWLSITQQPARLHC